MYSKIILSIKYQYTKILTKGLFILRAEEFKEFVEAERAAKVKREQEEFELKMEEMYKVTEVRIFGEMKDKIENNLDADTIDLNGIYLFSDNKFDVTFWKYAVSKLGGLGYTARIVYGDEGELESIRVAWD